ncbi:MAG TPA: phosphoribosylamine--glycine ligase [Chloroflexi bacterium]|nr:phosphoribosylamine--glycine ligase [Chloroflexota bacterium]
MNVLLIGSGGREHALAWKLAQSSKLTQLYTLPGNPGTAVLGINLIANPEDLPVVVEIARQKQIDLVVVGPEVPLALGLVDALREVGILVYGPSKQAARIETDKAFAKNFMARHGIPTADYANFTEFEAAWDYYQSFATTSQLPVIKAAGLAAGKGVILPETLVEAESVLREIMLEGKFGAAGAVVVIEERLIGREVSILAFTDGTRVAPMPPAQDHKRLLDRDRGPNTGGMGVFAPSPFAPPELVAWVVEHVLQPAVDGLRTEGHPFIGTLYAGMILTDDGPKTLEFNCRFGDPETQVVMPLLDSDLLEILFACAQGDLSAISGLIRWKGTAAVCVVLASQGYPNAYPRGLPIFGLGALPERVVAFHAGTATKSDGVVTNGGRVLGITTTAENISEARTLAYAGVETIRFEGMQYRTDIAKGF